jgi:hypothetical protein
MSAFPLFPYFCLKFAILLELEFNAFFIVLIACDVKIQTPFSQTWAYRLFIEHTVLTPEVSAEVDKVERLLSSATFSPVEIQSFTKYTDLPMEVKIKVWEFATPHLPGRIIPVIATKRPYCSPRYSCALPHQTLFYNDIALRHVLLNDYQLFPSGSGHAISTTNLENDTLLFSERSRQPTISLFRGIITEEVVKDVKRIAIEYNMKRYRPNPGRREYSGILRYLSAVFPT